MGGSIADHISFGGCSRQRVFNVCIMKELQQNRTTILAEIEALAQLCRNGDSVAASVVAFCGARCSQLLVEVKAESSLGKGAVEKAAQHASKWPIAYPALEDGRTNRIKEQVPLMLGRSLGLRVNKPKGTGMERSVRPGVRSLLEEALHQVAPDGKNHESQSNRAAIMASLINLFRRCNRGDSDAASIVAGCGVLFAELLADLLQSPRTSPGRKAAEEAARDAPEWPTAFQATRKGTHYVSEVCTPSMLGASLEFRINKHEGTKSDRELGEDQRVGFAFMYFEQLKRGRHLAKIYDTPRTAFWWELARQGHAAALVLRQPNFRLDTSNFKHVKVAAVRGIISELLGVVPHGLSKIWPILPILPGFDSKTTGVWIRSAVALAEAKCGGNWAKGPWPANLKTDAATRMSEGSGESPAHLEAVQLWMEYGFLKLADGLRR